MTARSLSTRAARAGGLPLARAVVLALLAVPAAPASAQTIAWEPLPVLPFTEGHQVFAVDFLHGEGDDADDPAADSLVAVIRPGGVLLYNPSDAGGAAGENGEVWGAWHPLCTNGLCSVETGVVTEAGSIVVGGLNRDISRSTDRGRTWAHHVVELYPVPLFETSLPALRGPDGAPALVAGVSDDGTTALSDGDGAAGTWVQAGRGFGYPQSFGEVPPSPALPNGRLLMGVWNGASYSDDGGVTYTPSNAFGQARYIAWSFTFLRQEGHPYGGVAYAGLENVGLYPAANAEVHRSDDGGRTWALAHRFTAEETGQPTTNGANVSRPILLATPDGALWAGVGQNNGFSLPFRGGVMRSADGGATWSRADAGFDGGDGRGYRMYQLVLARDGRLYAATDRGVWRTTGPAVAGEGGPSQAPEVGVSVRPNPAGGRVEVVVTLAEAGPVRVSVLDALGREVAVVLDGESAAGERVAGV
ncbi:MAG TPA: sialidase family protein, partial [Rubricoccaceae bacterium]